MNRYDAGRSCFVSFFGKLQFSQKKLVNHFILDPVLLIQRHEGTSWFILRNHADLKDPSILTQIHNEARPPFMRPKTMAERIKGGTK